MKLNFVRKMEIDFPEFTESDISAIIVLNPYWQEILLCMFEQGFFGEIWEEVQDTKINVSETIENLVYDFLGHSIIRRRT